MTTRISHATLLVSQRELESQVQGQAHASMVLLGLRLHMGPSESKAIAALGSSAECYKIRRAF